MHNDAATVSQQRLMTDSTVRSSLNPAGQAHHNSPASSRHPDLNKHRPFSGQVGFFCSPKPCIKPAKFYFPSNTRNQPGSSRRPQLIFSAIPFSHLNAGIPLLSTPFNTGSFTTRHLDRVLASFNREMVSRS